MNIKDSIDVLEQQIYVACSEGDYQTVNQLEQQLEKLRGEMEYPLDDDPYALEGRTFLDDDWR
ncbi:hypothetical protein CAG54_08395 [Vibrio sp. V27_P1S3P104]|uniref:hypothetical protein n=1 Tax=unclassified Vibrio TaxID=2614977 RepID=UPI00137251F0|nr:MULTISPECIES: hypothetical protein [unclassified Vibrio]NAW69615.1 hypothetical protein [Vibrio sp. V28_P6S34P95]NAX04017.1 hypothetical protein [Vibrio sp. V30_P3S12P165]NAX33010.1 hypothetical protein [Vibrio sp. V29_P1S30P107]NAX37515.1 hypothetical protein [Vibrio sp. V27_P1S3P104]NAX41294.1 hypothetical protein [Vibrio sp. V26_P1S5P106]